MIWLVKMMPFNDFRMTLSVDVKMKMINDKADLNSLDDWADKIRK